ncbi:cytochrome b-like heme/steroid binding domain containing protein [Acanthamoeba castellanii str. Neff]|uniref:Cytochrome b-like heme/steroid binding domain containing protein n=1 Tax=Acanthamoeba castellanii (strain ATCC 30010 / Neff) TaxID=1257118 RepID=L8GLY5_ACACF|nr:cytochrome b-like heme/steroid binding domain containing protein [Acanthamoeba castellanii str. Neff]ELR13738.1 cytochrome b-like heme/steroid binding domain containing protein [Acanthamoeba castellanii str. Neff]
MSCGCMMAATRPSPFYSVFLVRSLPFPRKVFDVTEGKRFYAKGGSYSFFAGRDASRSFATGEFEEENLTDDVTDLEPEQVAAIKEWQTQFERQYKYLGKVGDFYDAAGKATPALKKVKEKLQKAKIVVDQELEEKQQFPECNSRWTEKDGATVWCTESSGGIERSWKGYPRQFKSARAQNPSPDALECQR